MQKHIRKIRVALIALAIALILIPLVIVSITGNGFGELTANILVSLSIFSLIAAIMTGIQKTDKNKLAFKIGVSIGLLIIFLSLWF